MPESFKDIRFESLRIANWKIVDKRGLPHTSPISGGNKHVNGIVQERKLITLIPLNVTNENVILT